MSLGTQHDTLLSYLLEDGPHPGDSALAELAEAELPPGLAQRTLNAVELERTRFDATTQKQGSWFSKLGIGLMAAAAAIVLVVRLPDPASPIQADPSKK